MSTEDRSGLVKYALMGAGTIAIGAALYFLSREENTLVLDKEKFTKEKLKTLLEETVLEYTCIYCRNYNIMLKVRDARGGILPLEDLAQLKHIVELEINDKTA